MEIRFTIMKRPKGKDRVRYARGHAYTPKETVDYENFIKDYIRCNINHYFQREVPLYLNIKAFYKIPESVSKTVRQKMINGEILPTVKPDFDNVEKINADAMNKELYKDDAQICDSHFKKVYGEVPRVEICVGSIETKPDNEEKPPKKKGLTTREIEEMLKNSGKEWRAKRGLGR